MQIPGNHGLQSGRIFHGAGGRRQGTGALRVQGDGSRRAVARPAAAAAGGEDPRLCREAVQLPDPLATAPAAAERDRPAQGGRPDRRAGAVCGRLFRKRAVPGADAAGGGSQPALSDAVQQEPEPGRPAAQGRGNGLCGGAGAGHPAPAGGGAGGGGTGVPAAGESHRPAFRGFVRAARHCGVHSVPGDPEFRSGHRRGVGGSAHRNPGID